MNILRRYLFLYTRHRGPYLWGGVFLAATNAIALAIPRIFGWAVDALDAQAAESQGEVLLLKFPPSQGWSQKRLDDIIKRDVGGEAVSDKEKEFRKNYEAWLSAIKRRAAELANPKKAEPAPEQPAEEKRTEPVEEKKAE